MTDTFLHPFEDNYLYGHFENGQVVGGRIGYVRLFGIIAVFILVIASINYTNLATARAAQRVREIGIRKAVGASRAAPHRGSGCPRRGATAISTAPPANAR